MHRQLVKWLISSNCRRLRDDTCRCLSVSIPLWKHQLKRSNYNEFPRQSLEKIQAKRVLPVLKVSAECRMDEQTEVEVIRDIVDRLKCRGQEIILLDPIDNLYRRTPVHTAPQILPSREKLVEFFVSNADFFLINRTYWDNFIATLADFGFAPAEIVALLLHFGSNRVSNPAAPQTLLDLFQAFNDVYVKGDTVRAALLSYPALFDLSPATVRVFTTRLRDLLSKEQIVFTYKTYPQIFLQTDDFEGLHAKFAYLSNEMRLKPEEIMKCCWFAPTLEEIRLRHEFLVRTGAYVSPNAKKPLITKDNPELRPILQSTGKDFACRVAGVTLAEFEVFREMFNRQLADELRALEEADENR